ncbi:MAG TPA: hypothetical protein PLU45_02775 [Bacteroidales bacterium]|nr:hypothetical protein [Bacteroidales bacterium]
MKRTESSNKPDIEFEYSAMGNRIAKHVIPKNSAMQSTYYVCDALLQNRKTENKNYKKNNLHLV